MTHVTIQKQDLPVPIETVYNASSLMDRLAILHMEVSQSGDAPNAKKIAQLMEKLRLHEFSFGFCGHFSAGKSSMINHLMGEELLPSSPIPTSANLVKVRFGEPYARIYFKHQDPVHFSFPYNLEAIKQFCLNGDEVDVVEISHPSSRFNEGITIMDTPGIDSTDEAHRIATESALHLADVIFYVMDYNHVQSEVNVEFTKMLKRKSKYLFLIINQIDKHVNEELRFEDYQRSIEEAFKNWNVHPDGIFFTSIREKDHPRNQLEDLKLTITDIIKHKDLILTASVFASAEAILEDHLRWITEQNQEQLQAYQQGLHELSIEDFQKLQLEYHHLLAAQANLLQKRTDFVEGFKAELVKLLQSANITPFQTREFAKQFLEAQQPDFKVGFLFSAKKTQEERERRLQAFSSDFFEKVSAQVDWHVKELLVNYPKTFGIVHERFFASVYDLKVDLDSKILLEHIKKDAKVTGDYVLNYMKELSEAIKHAYRMKSLDKWEEMIRIFGQQLEEEQKRLQYRLQQIHLQIEAIKGIMEIEEKQQNDRKHLFGILKGEIPLAQLDTAMTLLSTPTETNFRMMEPTSVPLSSDKIQPVGNSLIPEEDQASTHEVALYDSRDRLRSMGQILRCTADLIKDLKGLKSSAKDLLLRAERLENSRFTVALFGAFSAGKSSFANALLGERVLPVSPNPTTATINRILPPDKHHPHGTVIVKLKSEQVILEEIQRALQLMEQTSHDLENAMEIINRIEEKHIPHSAKAHYTFLQAVKRGLQQMRTLLGKEINVDLDSFQAYVAEESKACFVEVIELYFTCPLTEQGITLVDTPGADSINARHTGVAFEYIKNADAIIFVTYYNHAFSTADREFLIQLGKVKDSFEMDKMFFIVNAADLAQSDEELAHVVNHVRDNLLNYGIRNPRIYPVSSQQAIAAKLQKKEQDLFVFRRFERDFMQFTLIGLTDLAIQAGEKEISRISDRIDSFIENASQSEEMRLQTITTIAKQKEKILMILDQLVLTSSVRSMEKEIEELLYYVKHRLFLRFPDFFKMAFHPGALRDEGQGTKVKLQLSLSELLQSLRFELAQEMRVTTFRLENYLRKLLKEIYQQIEKQMVQVEPQISVLPLGEATFPFMHFDDATIPLNEEELATTLSIFKSTKQFFVQDGKTKMRKEIEQKLQQPVSAYLEENALAFKGLYSDVLLKEVETLIKDFRIQMEEYFEGKTAALTNEVDLDELKAIQLRITQLLS